MQVKTLYKLMIFSNDLKTVGRLGTACTTGRLLWCKCVKKEKSLFKQYIADRG